MLKGLIYNGILLNFCTVNDISSKHQERDKKRYKKHYLISDSGV